MYSNIQFYFGRIKMFGLGSQEIMLILLVLLVVFGAAKLPQIGKGMGEAIKNFKKSVNDVEDAVDITPTAKKDEAIKQTNAQATSNAESKEETKA